MRTLQKVGVFTSKKAFGFTIYLCSYFWCMGWLVWLSALIGIANMGKAFNGVNGVI